MNSHPSVLPLGVGRHRAVFTEPAIKVPSDTHVDGPLLGNGDVGVVLCGPPERLRFCVSKNDFWKSKPGFPNGGPRPIGGLDLLSPSLEGATYRVEVDLLTAELSGVVSTPDATVNLRAKVCATQNVLLVEASVVSGSLKIQPGLWGCSGDESDSDSGTVPLDWVTRRYAGADLEWPCEAAMAQRQWGLPADNGVVEAGQKIQIAVAVRTSFEASQPLQSAVLLLEALDEARLVDWESEHTHWWRNFWSESSVSIGEEVIERHYYGAQYILACCCRNSRFPPGLWGNWITTDTPAWAGDYHLNYNYQAPFWGLYSSNHLQLVDCYDAPLLDYIDAGKRNASQFLEIPGVYIEVGIGPLGFCSSLFNDEDQDPGSLRAAELDHGHQFWGQKSNAVFAAVPMLLRWHHTLDLNYGRSVYPYLIEVANFWEAYLVFEDGRYVIYNDAFNEAGPWEGPAWEELRQDCNPVISLGCARQFFGGLIEMSSALGCDAGRQTKWRNITQQLSDFPVTRQDGRLLTQGAEGGPSAQKIGATRLTCHGTVWPCSVVGPELMPDYFTLLREEVSTWGTEVWVDNGNAFDTVPPAAARLRIDPEHILSMMRAKIEAHALPNLFIVQGGGGIETCGGITAGINEMLLQSYEGVLELFPCWPVTRDAKFENLRAWGAFLVSSELKGGEVQFARIVSEKGGDCRVRNPWTGLQVRITRNGVSSELVEGTTVKFQTSPGEQIEMSPSA